MKKIGTTGAVVRGIGAFAIAGALITGNYYALKYQSIITTFLGQSNYKVVDKGTGSDDTEYFKSEFSSSEERLAADAEAAIMAEGEGIVLLKNDEKALPMNAGKVSLFGVSSADILYGGGGSGAVNTATVPSLKDALEAKGFSVNPTLWDFYSTGAASSIRMDVKDIAGTGRYLIHEASPELFTGNEENSLSDYSDAAIVVFARSGGESGDIPTVYDESYAEDMDVEGYMGAFHSDKLDNAEDVGKSYLELTTNEQDLLSYVSGKFDKVIVVINSGNAMELSFIDETQYGVDACVWIGNPGQDGLYALGDVLTGAVNPSGKTVDTYAYDATGAPAIENFGYYTMTGADDKVNSQYVVYQEGIYVGYRYYETRYEDTVLSQGNADGNVGITKDGASSWQYSDEVQFPFGYGLSYTTFEQELLNASKSGDEFKFEVKVTNTGDVSGKSVVELYMQSPYTDYDKSAGIEKASVELAGFAKTDELAVGDSQTLTITVDEKQLNAYDSNANGGEGTYILEEGTYYFAIGDDAHDAVNNILAAKGASGMDEAADASKAKTFDVESSDKYSVSTYTGAQITNQFADADMKTYDSSFTYLTRSDWTGTWPSTYVLNATEEMASQLDLPAGTDDPNAEMPTTGASNGLSLVMLKDVAVDDTQWDMLLDELTAEEMYNLVRVGGYQTQTVNSVSAPSTVDVDGPANVGTAGITDVQRPEETYPWPSEVTLASTWNIDILTRMGELIGEDCLAQGSLNFAGWYAPAMNIHRTAFSGRNFEYYSEDGFLSGQMGLATCTGARSKGVITFVKHFALNDQETGRIGLSTFSNEQAIREIYLAAFEPSMTSNTTLGAMLAMNRIGFTWSGNDLGLSTNVTRNEWGYDGILITDQASYPEAFPCLAIRGGLEGGTDLYLNTGADNWQIDGYASNATVMNQLRTASKHVLYAVSRSFAMNGISSTASVQSILPLWQKALYALDVIICGLLAFWINTIVKRRKLTD
ncbi:MAG: glycoside hydrolase family 3 C-terminal domain-containing protein [Butyrivibrio sp.]|nr:glycoside hydrolase family 3 C-terminal domain-containing protein [Butyrivibrio sp.]